MNYEKEFKWLGKVLEVIPVGEYKVVKVLHKSQSLTEETIGYHIISPGANKPHYEYFPNFATVLLGIACLESRVDTGNVTYMARVALIKTTQEVKTTFEEYIDKK